MTAAIFSMSDFRTVFAPEDEARDQVTRQIAHRVTPTILSQAQAHAVANVRRLGMHPNVAALRAVSWALCAIHPEPPEAA